MRKFDQTRFDRALDTVWEWTWGLLFVCTMTVLSMATQRYSGYQAAVSNQSREASLSNPAVANVRR